VDPDRLMPLTDAARLAGCSRKSLERRVERGSLPADLDADGRRAVRAVDLLRAGLVSLAPVRSQAGVDPREMADAVSEARAMQAALDATEAALARAREEVLLLRRRVMDAEARAAVAEEDLTRLVLGGAPDGAARARGRGRLRLKAG
jgi:hypothetical protein